MSYDKTEMNAFVQNLYDQKMKEGKHGHYEAMFHVVHKAIAAVLEKQAKVDMEPVHFCDYGYEGWGKIDATSVADNISYGMTVETYYPAFALAALQQQLIEAHTEIGAQARKNAELRVENERLTREVTGWRLQVNQRGYEMQLDDLRTQLAQAQDENERLRGALEKTTFELEVCDQSDYGRKWLWPETAHASAMKNVREAIDAARTALENKHD